MKDLKQLLNLTCWVIICFLILSESDGKAQVKKMSAKDMTETSTAVLYGKCKKIKCEWNENRSAIYTYVTIVPEGYIKGNLGSEVVVAVPGGRVDDILVEVAEAPIFIEDEEVVAFICKSPKGRNLIIGGFQGKMKIEKDPITGKRYVIEQDFDEELVGEELVAVTQDSEKAKKHERVALEDYVAKLKGYAKN